MEGSHAADNGNGKVDEEAKEVGELEANGQEADTAVEEEGARGEESEEELEEEEVLVILELCDFKNHPVFDDYASATLEVRRSMMCDCLVGLYQGIDTATPVLRIGEYALHGQLEETVGTSYFYDTDTSRAPDKAYQFAGQTIKKVKFTIAPPEEP
ncbi:hypothetical protein BBJ28_00016663 [Nothophytophthora sp. Chile5]|nr:hypothetical protein BBJ28_00016663 [Nothophytophthora sp. Chile5]